MYALRPGGSQPTTKSALVSCRDRILHAEGCPWQAAQASLTLKEESPNMRSTLFCGVDLHSNNARHVIRDQEDRQLFRRRLLNRLPVPLESVAPKCRKPPGHVRSYKPSTLEADIHVPVLNGPRLR